MVWLGTGENNNQRSVSYGDGIYKSIDAGATWTRMGLESSEHIQNILIDPRDSNVVYVSAIGPLWNAGGDRGLYKTIDGGKTWKAVLTISADTGVTDVAMDPKNPNVLYAAAYQRRRAVGQLVGGGPESGLYKTTDGGAKWTKLAKGLPTVEIGRIGVAINWKNPNTVYALVTAQLGQGGFFRSDDAGASWMRVGRSAPGGGPGGGRAGGGREGAAAARASRSVRTDRCGSADAPRPHQRQRRQPRRRQAADAVAHRRMTAIGAAIPATTMKSSSMDTIRRRSGHRRPRCGGARTAAGHGRQCRCRACTSTTTRSSSTRPTRITSSSATTAGCTRPTTG